ncbi:MAG TPA: ABC transporter ATP-binding protein [Candidatus Binataceae bacterium]|nr:ABC transporter ATP-binding protein [Candidatus Binataceae bacterium]
MPAILEAQGLNKRFGAVTAAANINVGIEQNSIVGLIGGNGAGKTTFINMVTGYLKPDTGTIRYSGRDITRLAPRNITQLGVCRSFQIPQLYDSLTVHENLLIALGIVVLGAKKWASTMPVRSNGVDEAADTTLNRFGLESYRNKVSAVLPEGVRKLLDIAMAMVVRPKILLLDEPTSGVSADQKFVIMDMVMDALRSDSVTILFVEHDMDIVSRYTQRVLAFYEGRIIADGKPEGVLSDSEVRKYVTGEGQTGAVTEGASHAAN